VRAGASWDCGYIRAFGANQATPQFGFFWLPIGTNALGATFERIGEAVAPRWMAPVEIAEPPPRVQGKNGDEFVEMIELLTGRPVSPETKPRLLALLRGMGAHV